MPNDRAEITFLKDKEWSKIDGELCLVSEFTPLGGSAVSNGKIISPNTSMPYASITFECKKMPEKITGFVTHKIDFANLWEAFEERGINKEKEEVLMYWTMKHYNNKVAKGISASLFSLFGATNLPKIIVMICPKGTYKSVESFNLMSDKEVKVFVYGLMSIKFWVPEVIK